MICRRRAVGQLQSILACSTGTSWTAGATSRPLRCPTSLRRSCAAVSELCAPPDNQTWETCHDARPLAVARGCFEAFVSKDRAAIEELFSENNHFTSPIDNALDRNIYLARCWPNSHAVTGFSFVYQVETAFIVYVARTAAAARPAEGREYRGGCGSW